jgi:hypothetical protein
MVSISGPCIASGRHKVLVLPTRGSYGSQINAPVGLVFRDKHLSQLDRSLHSWKLPALLTILDSGSQRLRRTRSYLAAAMDVLQSGIANAHGF